MDVEYLQSQRYKLQKRFRRLHSARPNAFRPALMYLWQFIRDHELFADIATELEAKEPEAEDAVRRIVEENEPLHGATETEAAAIGLGLLRYCAQNDEEQAWRDIVIPYRAGSGADEWARYFTEVLIEPLYEYLDEQVDDQGATLALLRRYKHRSEWFDRERLYHLWKDDTSKGEARLAGELYKYLYDQGLDFHIEPKSASGRVDLIDIQRGDYRLLADAKILNPERGQDRSYLADGFRQLYEYCVDFQQTVGYLVIFKTSEHNLRFLFEKEESQVPHIVYNHKTLFLLEVDIYQYDDPASERGRLEPYEVTEENLLVGVEESSEG